VPRRKRFDRLTFRSDFWPPYGLAPARAVLKNSFVRIVWLERSTRVLPSAMRTLTMSSVPEAGGDSLEEGEAWLEGFYEGRRETMEDCYRQHFGTVDAAVARVLQGADRETVVQDVFARLMSDADLRLMFKGGRMTAWLSTLSRNLAIDFVRHRRFERPDGLVPAGEASQSCQAVEHRTEARLLIERFRKECLPPQWAPVFEARFVRQMDQTAAAIHVGICRTTLAYREYKIRGLLRSFALRGMRP
jgi:RNA polymerase sigma-70 factor (ECF subfamily)